MKPIINTKIYVIHFLFPNFTGTNMFWTPLHWLLMYIQDIHIFFIISFIYFAKMKKINTFWVLKCIFCKWKDPPFFKKNLFLWICWRNINWVDTPANILIVSVILYWNWWIYNLFGSKDWSRNHYFIIKWIEIDDLSRIIDYQEGTHF